MCVIFDPRFLDNSQIDLVPGFLLNMHTLEMLTQSHAFTLGMCAPGELGAPPVCLPRPHSPLANPKLCVPSVLLQSLQRKVSEWVRGWVGAWVSR